MSFTSSIYSLGRLGFIIGAPLIVALACFLFMREYFMLAADADSKEQIVIEIAQGSNLQQIAQELQKQKLIKHWRSLDLLARLKGQDKNISAGEYRLSAALSPKQILEKLVSGEVIRRRVTFREGTSIWDYGKLLEEQGIIEAEKFDRALKNPELLRLSGIGAKSFEGYFFPDTYSFSRPIDAKKIIWLLLEQAEKRWKPTYTKRSIELNMNRHEILTLASIIEKESGNVSEQALVSSVFHNRLRSGMRLQSDPTAVYAMPNFSPPITRKHLESDNPYNTYKISGLPPGPICNPGESAIRAALYPEESQYLFFVASGTGDHVFSTTLKEHNPNFVARG